MHHFQLEIPKIFWGGAQPLLDPIPTGEGTPLPEPVKQRLFTIALNRILMNLCLHNWKSQGISCALKSDHTLFIF